MVRVMMVLIVACMLGSVASQAQESDIRVGFGVSMSQSVLVYAVDQEHAYTPWSFATVSIPVFLTKNFRIEPEVGYLSGSHERTYFDKTTSTASFTQMRLGAGVHYFIDRVGGAENVSLYLGPEFALAPMSTKSKPSSPGSKESTTSQSNTLLGFVLGGEYSFAKRFSVGTAVHWSYIIIGEEDPLSSTYSEVSESYLNISTSIRFRFYFN